jgi:glycosyltransferase involved in cell wall biosynthesis
MVGFKDDSPFGIGEAELRQWTDDQLIEYKGSTDDIRTALIGADCVVLPSYREGTPRSLLEAAAMGKPLIATNVPGCIEVVDHEVNGYLCEARNAPDLARQMMRMLALDDASLATMGVASRHKVETKFDEILVIRKYRDTIAQVLQQDIARPVQDPVPAE